MQDEVFGSLTGDLRDIITEKILEDVQGRMLEDIVFLETKRTYGSKRNVFKLKFASGEFDMVIQDKAKKQCEIFEIKHSKQMVTTQYRHINNEEKISLTEAQQERYSKMFEPIEPIDKAEVGNTIFFRFV